MPKGYIVFVCFVCPFICPSVIPSVNLFYHQVLLRSFFDYLQLCSHWSETFHIWYGDTWEGSLPFYIYEPLGHAQGGARGQTLGHPNKVEQVYCSLFIETTS